ncbi:MAG: hypothetical protein MK110_10960 [Fuerstiella sp.]|nr:hypothetical protein [Fuerstiella sp.]
MSGYPRPPQASDAYDKLFSVVIFGLIADIFYSATVRAISCELMNDLQDVIEGGCCGQRFQAAARTPQELHDTYQ